MNAFPEYEPSPNISGNQNLLEDTELVMRIATGELRNSSSACHTFEHCSGIVGARRGGKHMTRSWGMAVDTAKVKSKHLQSKIVALLFVLTYMYMFNHGNLYIYIYIYLHNFIHIHIYICKISMYVCLFWIYIYIKVYIAIYIHIYIYISYLCIFAYVSVYTYLIGMYNSIIGMYTRYVCVFFYMEKTSTEFGGSLQNVLFWPRCNMSKMLFVWEGLGNNTQCTCFSRWDCRRLLKFQLVGDVVDELCLLDVVITTIYYIL